MKSRFVLVAGLGLAMVVALFVLITATTASATSAATPATVKVTVDAKSTDVVKQLPALGGQLMQDYGDL